MADSETVVCWTCGSEVDKEEIEETLERLQTLRQDTLTERSELDSEISDLERRNLNASQNSVNVSKPSNESLRLKQNLRIVKTVLRSFEPNELT